MNEETTSISEQETENVQMPQPDLSNKKKKELLFIIASAVVLVALAVGIAIYNTPANRVQRQLDLGNKYLEEENYEQAAIAFEEAIAIDERCMEAYMGGLEAYLGAGDVSGAQDFYDRTLAMLSGMDEDFLAVNMDYAAELYLSADKVYGNDWNKIAQVLEEGYTVTGEDARIKDKLIDNYIQMGEEETKEGSYEEALTIYDRLLELDNMNMETIRGLCDCLSKYIDILMAAGRYDEIRILAYKYKDIAVNVDFDSILARIAELERIEADNRAFMQKVYELMAAQDYEGELMEVYASEAAKAFIEQLGNDNYIYFPDNNDSHTGVGAGVYQDEDGDDGMYYYFYYGDYVGGERKGTGTEFLKLDYGYYVFTGVWDNDAPNGEGTVISKYKDIFNNSYSEVCGGMLIDGLWDGQIQVILTDDIDGKDSDLSFSAVKGIPTEDKTEECRSKIGCEGMKENEYVFAYDDRNRGWKLVVNKGGTVGIRGFAPDY